MFERRKVLETNCLFSLEHLAKADANASNLAQSLLGALAELRLQSKLLAVVLAIQGVQTGAEVVGVSIQAMSQPPLSALGQTWGGELSCPAFYDAEASTHPSGNHKP